MGDLRLLIIGSRVRVPAGTQENSISDWISIRLFSRFVFVSRNRSLNYWKNLPCPSLRSGVVRSKVTTP